MSLSPGAMSVPTTPRSPATHSVPEMHVWPSVEASPTRQAPLHWNPESTEQLSKTSSLLKLVKMPHPSGSSLVSLKSSKEASMSPLGAAGVVFRSTTPELQSFSLAASPSHDAVRKSYACALNQLDDHAAAPKIDLDFSFVGGDEVSWV